LPAEAGAGDRDGQGGGDAQGDARSDASPLSPLCPTAYIVSVGTSFYKLVPDAYDWATAAADCADDEQAGIQRHTHLIVMTDDNEYTAITTQLGTLTGWVGYTKQVTFPVYTWVDDEAGLATWGPGQPSMISGLDCVAFTTGALYSKSCLEMHPYACECDVHPNDPAVYN